MRAHIEDTGVVIFLYIIEHYINYVILIQQWGEDCMPYGLPGGFGKAELSVLSATHAQWPYKLTILLILCTIIFKTIPNSLQ